MKVKTPSLIKKIIATLSNKTSELRIRIMIFFLLHKNNIDKTSLTHSLHALVSHQHPSHVRSHVKKDGLTTKLCHQHYDQEEVDMNEDLCIQPSHASSDGDDMVIEEQVDITSEDNNDALQYPSHANEGEEEYVHPSHANLEEEEEEEEDIDQAADMFIQRFKRQMQLQKQHSFDSHHHDLASSSPNNNFLLAI